MTSAVITREQVEERVRQRVQEELRVPDAYMDGKTDLIDLPGASPSKLHRIAIALERDFGIRLYTLDPTWLTSVRTGADRVVKALGSRCAG